MRSTIATTTPTRLLRGGWRPCSTRSTKPMLLQWNKSNRFFFSANRLNASSSRSGGGKPEPSSSSSSPSPSSSASSASSASSSALYNLFVAVTPGLESLLHEELSALLPQSAQPVEVEGGVECMVTRVQLWKIAWQSRLAESMRVRIGPPFRATNFSQLSSGLPKLSWRPFLPASFLSTRAANDAPFGFPEVQAVCRNSDLYHSKAIEERVDKFLQDLYFQSNSPSFGASLTQPSVVPAKNDHSPQFYVRIVNNEAQISVDASGELLHKRASGDKHISKAPLRETMASACLHAAGWKASNEQADRPLLWDPFCGSGTLVLEALDILNPTGRTQQAPSRHFAFEQWSSHSPALYLRFLQSLHAASSSSSSSSEFNQTSYQKNNDSLRHVSAVGSDIDEKCIEASRHNLSEAPPFVQRKGRFYRGDFEEVLTKQLLPQLRAKNKDKKRDVLIVTNLPYGIRTSPKGKELEKLFLRFGQMMSRHKDLLREAFVLDGSPGHVFPKVVTGARNLGLECRSVLRFSNRGIPVQLHRVSPL